MAAPEADALTGATPVGVWKTIDDESGKAKSHVKIYERNGKLYGKVTKLLLNPGANGPAVAKEYEAKGAVVSAIYQNALQGFAGEFSGELLTELEADPRVKALEADSVIHLGNLNAQTMTGRLVSGQGSLGF